MLTRARLDSGLTDVQVIGISHELGRSSEARVAGTPSLQEYRDFLQQQIADATASNASPARKSSIVKRLQSAMNEGSTPSAKAWHVQRSILMRARAAKDAERAFIVETAQQSGQSVDSVEAIYKQHLLTGLPSNINKNAIPASTEAFAPSDRHSHWAAYATQVELGLAQPLTCAQCGQFQGEGHVCPQPVATADMPTTSDTSPQDGVQGDGEPPPQRVCGIPPEDLAREAMRVFAERGISAISLDIETDTSQGYGLDPQNGRITGVVLSGVVRRVFSGDDEKKLLEDLETTLQEAPPSVIITWNGQAFDMPFIATRMAAHGLGSKLQTEYDPSIPMKYDPIAGHEGAYRAQWGEHKHCDIMRQYREDADRRNISCSLKSMSRAVLGAEAIEVDRERMHELTPQEYKSYILSDGDVTLAMGAHLDHLNIDALG